MRESEININASKRLLDKAWKYFVIQDYENAMIFVNKAIKKNPQNSDCYVLKGDIFVVKNNLLKAIKNYSNAMLFGLRNEFIYYFRGFAQQKHGNFLKALNDYNLALELNPIFHPALSQRGIIFIAFKKYASAIKDFDAALEIQPDDYGSILNKCSAYEQRGDLSKALDEINAFVFERKNDVPTEIIMERGVLNSKSGFRHQAIRDFSWLIHNTDHFLIGYQLRANEYEKIGEYKKAESDWDKVNELKNLGDGIDYV
jgi:tetratricopeptide (TPR) repeat protein